MAETVTIPHRLIRTAPDQTTPRMDRFWQIATGLHPDWERVDLRKYRMQPERFPLTSPYWDDCKTGAQWADLVRFEELWSRGGVYIDSDVEVLKPFDTLTEQYAFAGFEDSRTVCIAVLGFTPNHPILKTAIKLAIQRRHLDTWKAGMGAFNAALALCDYDGINLLPQATFYPWSWIEDEPADWRENNPGSYTAHYWAGSWLGKRTGFYGGELK